MGSQVAVITALPDGGIGSFSNAPAAAIGDPIALWHTQATWHFKYC